MLDLLRVLSTRTAEFLPPKSACVPDRMMGVHMYYIYAYSSTRGKLHTRLDTTRLSRN